MFFRQKGLFVCFALLFAILGNKPASAINEWCQRREDCTRTVGNVECFYSKCRCQENNINVEFFGREECLPLALSGPGSPCKHDLQCTRIMMLLSRCNKGPHAHNTQGTCECYDVHDSGRKETIFANGVCTYRKTVGERCAYDEECIESIGPYSRCKDRKCTKSQVKPGRPSSAHGIIPQILVLFLGVLCHTLFTKIV